MNLSKVNSVTSDSADQEKPDPSKSCNNCNFSLPTEKKDAECQEALKGIIILLSYMAPLKPQHIL